MRISAVIAALAIGAAARAAPQVWLEHTDLPEALMVSNDTGAAVAGCKVEWAVRYDDGGHYTEIALTDLPANGSVRVTDCTGWWDERHHKTMDVSLTLYGPDGKALARKSYEGVFKLVARRGLPTDGWSAKACREATVAAAFDGNLATRWDTAGKQEAGQWYQLDMGKPQQFAGLIIDTRHSANDYPTGLTVEASDDGETWKAIGEIEDVEPMNKRGKITLSFEPVTARHIKLTLTKPHGENWFWSMHELSVLPPSQ